MWFLCVGHGRIIDILPGDLSTIIKADTSGLSRYLPDLNTSQTSSPSRPPPSRNSPPTQTQSESLVRRFLRTSPLDLPAHNTRLQRSPRQRTTNWNCPRRTSKGKCSTRCSSRIMPPLGNDLILEMPSLSTTMKTSHRRSHCASPPRMSHWNLVPSILNEQRFSLPIDCRGLLRRSDNFSLLAAVPYNFRHEPLHSETLYPRPLSQVGLTLATPQNPD